MAPRSSDGGDDFELDRDRRWPGGYLNGRPRWVRVAVAGQRFGVEFFIGRKVFLHVGEEDRHIDNIIPAHVGVFEHEPNIFEDRAALFLNIVTNDLTGRIERDSGNFFASARARSDSGKKKQIADAFRVRKRADRLRRARTLERLVHFQVSLSTGYIDGAATASSAVRGPYCGLTG